MDSVPWPAALVGLPFWFGPPLLLIVLVTRDALVRNVFGAGLVAALAVLYLSVCQWLNGPGWPIWIEGLFLWGPVTLAVCGAAALTDRWLSRRRLSDGGPAPAARRPMGSALLAAVFIGWSACCGGCVFTPAAEMVDLHLESPTRALVLPMPEELTLASADRECGSLFCSETYLVGSPDEAGPSGLTERLWAHLVETKGWTRLRPDAGCQRPGWFLRNEFCLFVDEQPGSAAVLKVHVTGLLAVGR